MKILIISNMYPSEQKPYSGLFVVNQVDAIKDKLNNEDIIDFYYMKRTFTNKIGSVIKYLKFFINFIFFVKKKNIKYDIVHIHYYFPTIYLGLLYKIFFNRNVKIVVTFHGFDLYRTKKNFLFKIPFKYIDKCIAVSENMCKDLTKYYKKNIYNIPAGINSIFKKENKIKKYDIIYVGSFYEEKGFDRLCNLLVNFDKRLNVCIIGSGHLETILDKVLASHKHKIDVYHNLSQDKIVDFLNQSRILLNLSREESFGLSMTEAMSCGLPVIATKTDGSLEQIIDNKNGFIINREEDNENIIINNFIDSIKKLLQDKSLLIKLGDNALKSSEKYNLNYISKEIILIYKGIIE